MAHRPEMPSDPAVVVINPDDEVTPESFAAWLDRRQAGEPVDPGVKAADTLAEARAAGEVGRVVIDASAGSNWSRTPFEVEHSEGCCPADAVPCVPELFYVECGGLLRRGTGTESGRPRKSARLSMSGWPGRCVLPRCAGCSPTRGDYEPTSPPADAVYVALASTGAPTFSSDDIPLANTPGLPVRVLHLP